MLFYFGWGRLNTIKYFGDIYLFPHSLSFSSDGAPALLLLYHVLKPYAKCCSWGGVFQADMQRKGNL